MLLALTARTLPDIDKKLMKVLEKGNRLLGFFVGPGLIAGLYSSRGILNNGVIGNTTYHVCTPLVVGTLSSMHTTNNKHSM